MREVRTSHLPLPPATVRLLRHPIFMVFTLEDIAQGPEGLVDVFERTYHEFYHHKEGAPESGEVYFHGTDLTRARLILEAMPIKLYNPWAPCTQPED